MILGIGTDIILTERVARAVGNESFLKKQFTQAEISISPAAGAKRFQTLAGNFAAKEAVAKALGTGFRGFGLIDVEILRDEAGRPRVVLYGGAKALADSLGIKKLHVSISHCENYATAFAVAEGGI